MMFHTGVVHRRNVNLSTTKRTRTPRSTPECLRWRVEVVDSIDEALQSAQCSHGTSWTVEIKTTAQGFTES